VDAFTHTPALQPLDDCRCMAYTAVHLVVYVAHDAIWK
jgi:hypothetical protein